MSMGIKFSYQKNPSPLIISVAPQPREAVVTREPLRREEIVTREPVKSNLVHSGSKSSLLSSSSSSSLVKGKPRRVSFDLLAEMAYAFPEQPLSPVLVELSDSENEEEVVGDICDGGSSLSDVESGGVKGEGRGGRDRRENRASGGTDEGGMKNGALKMSAKQNVMHCVVILFRPQYSP